MERRQGKTLRRSAQGVLGGMLTLALMMPTGAAMAQQPYPQRPVTMLIGYAPGGGTDIVGRVLARELEQELDQPVVVENRAGAGTLIAATAVSRAQPDGYTLFFGTNAMVINSLLQPSEPYDVVNDFTPVGMVTVQSLALVVNPGLKIATVPELIRYARENPGKLNFASSGVGTAQHVAGEAFAQATGVDIMHVPYRGAGPAIQELIAGRVDMMFTGLLGLKDHIRDKRMVLLATTGNKRTTATPDTPSVAEAAKIADFSVDSWQGLFAPANTPPEIVARLSQALREVERKGTLGARFVQEGMEVSVSSPDELRRYVSQDRQNLRGLVSRIKQN